MSVAATAKKNEMHIKVPNSQFTKAENEPAKPTEQPATPAQPEAK